MSSLEFQIRNADDSNQRFYWRVVSYGDVLARSETMYDKASCQSAAQNVKSGNVKGYFTDGPGNDGKYRWKVTGWNNRTVINSTDAFATREGAAAVANKVKDNATNAVIVDQTKKAGARLY